MDKKKYDDKTDFDYDVWCKEQRQLLDELSQKAVTITAIENNSIVKAQYDMLMKMMKDTEKCELCEGGGHDFYKCPLKKQMDSVCTNFKPLRKYWGRIKIKQLYKKVKKTVEDIDANGAG